MQPKQTQPQYSNILHWGDICTCIYVPALLAVLRYTNLYLTIGYYKNIYFLVLLAVAELVKYALHSYYKNSKTHKNIIKESFKTAVLICGMFMVVYLIAVLFGAPAFSHMEQNSMFALLVTITTALPTSLCLGYDKTIDLFLSLTAHQGTETTDLFLTKIRATIFGAWLSAIVIPLDWKRPWQVWPIPCCMGALVGYAVGCLIACALYLRWNGKTFKRTGKYTL